MSIKKGAQSRWKLDLRPSIEGNKNVNKNESEEKRMN